MRVLRNSSGCADAELLCAIGASRRNDANAYRHVTRKAAEMPMLNFDVFMVQRGV
jgi:hypothetical protein